jgi:lysozyme
MEPPMALSPRGLDFIKAREGFNATVYEDMAGHPTIGYGHRLRAGEAFPTGIDEAGAALLLAQDVAVAVAAVNRLVAVDLTQAQFDALVSFTYNVGAGNLQGSTLLRLLNERDAAGAAAQFALWDHDRVNGGQLAVNQGLLARRLAEWRLFADEAYG